MKQETTKYTIKVMDKAFAVLKSFSMAKPRMSFAELLRANKDIDKTALYRILVNFTAQGLLFKNERSGEYSPGMEFLRLAPITLAGFDLRDAARPFLEEIHAKTGETVILNIRNLYRGICLDCIKSAKPIAITADIGRQVPLLRGASGMILVAHLPRHELKELYEHEKALLKADFETIVTELSGIRKAGHAITFAALDPETAGVSFPIMDITGSVLAGLSCLGPEYRFEGDHLEKVIRVTREGSSALCRLLGYEQP